MVSLLGPVLTTTITESDLWTAFEAFGRIKTSAR
jgi:hypothetical protein